MAFLSPAVGCLLKKRLTKGGDQGHFRTPPQLRHGTSGLFLSRAPEFRSVQLISIKNILIILICGDSVVEWLEHRYP